MTLTLKRPLIIGMILQGIVGIRLKLMSDIKGSKRTLFIIVCMYHFYKQKDLRWESNWLKGLSIKTHTRHKNKKSHNPVNWNRKDHFHNLIIKLKIDKKYYHYQGLEKVFYHRLLEIIIMSKILDTRDYQHQRLMALKLLAIIN